MLCETELLDRWSDGLLNEFLKDVVSLIVYDKLDCDGLLCYFVFRLLVLLLLKLLDLDRLPLVLASLSAILFAIFDLVGGGLGRFLVSLQCGICLCATSSAKRLSQYGQGTRLSFSFGIASDISIAC